jgi:flagellar hook-associated protein 2
MDPIASFSGLSSGVDYQSLVDQIIQVDRQPAALAEASIKTAQQRQTAWSSYRALVSTLATAADALRTGTAFDARTVSVAGTGAGGRPILGATSSGAALTGSYQVEVTALATAGVASTAVQADSVTALGVSGSVTINGQALTVDAADSLEAIRDKVNALNTGATPTGVSAYVVNTGAGSVLVMRADATGSAAFDVTDGGALAALGATVTAGTDAAFTLDGVAITRATNTVSDVISGVTLTLSAAEPGTAVQVTVGQDASAAKDAMQKFVDAYNAVVDFFQSQTPTATASNPNATRPPLAGDSLLANGRAALPRLVHTSLDSNPATMRLLSDAGVSIGRDGKLSFDAGKFDAAYAADPAALQTLVADRAAAFKSWSDGLTTFGTGMLDVKKNSLQGSIDRLNDRVTAIDARLDVRKAQLLQQFARMESVLAQLQSQASGLSGQIASLTASQQQG